MSIYRELSYDQEIDVVRGIQFSVLGPEEVVRRSVVEVTKTDTYNGTEPVIGGLFDPRMGVLEHNRICATCEQKNIFCPGHFGHIQLARPVFHPMFFGIAHKLLKCVCFRCSRLVVSTRSTRKEFAAEVKRIMQIKNLHKRWDALLKLSANTKLKRCGDDMENETGEHSGCRARQPSRWIKENGMKIEAEWKDATETTRRELTAEEVLKIFKRIPEEDMELLGFHSQWNRPDWMICTVLPVPPPAVRPSIIEENGQRREDDLTHKLSDIVKYNQQLKQRIEQGKGTEEHLKVLTNLIQYHVATFMDNQIPGLPVAQQRNGRKLKSIADRLKKKEGRIRGNLNGKRVDQSARSVITPDPYIGLDELGVPVKIAMNITFPEEVNRYNMEEMRKLVRNGPDVWPGAKYVRLVGDGVTKTLKYADREKLAEELREGDIVDRHIRDGDYVLFNRQPSLHKMSMMGHKVVVMPYQTFRLNVTCTAPYNADFDGDKLSSCPQQVAAY
jgi:DNA-directed RNA polymerase II subunit RPB1